MLDGYIDADMVGDIDSRKSTSGYLMIFVGGVALSTIEDGYIGAIEACKEMLWLKRFLHELGLVQEMYNLCKNSSFHSKSKHIDVIIWI